MKIYFPKLLLALALCLLPAVTTAAAPPLQEYQGQVASPNPNAVVRGQVTVSGTANHPNFWKYELRVAPGSNPSVGDDQWYRVVVREQPVNNGALGTWDTTVLPDGVYTLRLRVVRLDGNWQDFDVLPLNVSNVVPPTATAVPPTATPVPSSTAVPPTATAVPPSPTLDSSPTVQSSATIGTIATLTPLGEGGAATLTPSTGSEGTPDAPPTAAASATPIVIDAPTIIVPTSSTTTDPAAPETEEEPAIAVAGEGAPPTPGSGDASIPDIPDTFGSSLDVSTLASACFTGAAFTAGVFLLVGALYLLRSLVTIFR